MSLAARAKLVRSTRKKPYFKNGITCEINPCAEMNLPLLDLPDFLELEDELAKPVVLVDLACTLSKL